MARWAAITVWFWVVQREGRNTKAPHLREKNFIYSPITYVVAARSITVSFVTLQELLSWLALLTGKPQYAVVIKNAVKHTIGGADMFVVQISDPHVGAGAVWPSMRQTDLAAGKTVAHIGSAQKPDCLVVSRDLT